MHTRRNTEAKPLRDEDQLLDRLQRLHKRSDKDCIGRIGVNNSEGHIRMAIFAFTDAELNGAIRLLEDRNFTDELNYLIERDEGNGGIEVEPVYVPHPEYEYLFNEPKV